MQRYRSSEPFFRVVWHWVVPLLQGHAAVLLPGNLLPEFKVDSASLPLSWSTRMPDSRSSSLWHRMQGQNEPAIRSKLPKNSVGSLCVCRLLLSADD